MTIMHELDQYGTLDEQDVVGAVRDYVGRRPHATPGEISAWLAHHGLRFASAYVGAILIAIKTG